MSIDSFKELMDRVKAGDQQAAFQVALGYGPVIRQIARRLIDRMRLRRFFDSTDIVQSVLFHFFKEVKKDKFTFADPADLAHLLMVMVHNRVIDKARHLHAERDKRVQPAEGLEQFPADAEEPNARLSRQEMAERARGLLSEDEWRLVEARISSQSWEEIAGLLGIEPDAARMRYARILQRLKDTLVHN
jgi:RNA polymerase sigma factor (sigma-70 family)